VLMKSPSLSHRTKIKLVDASSLFQEEHYPKLRAPHRDLSLVTNQGPISNDFHFDFVTHTSMLGT
ncbi:hypothetical protein ACQP3J_32090, partial [Escherichia coli]